MSVRSVQLSSTTKTFDMVMRDSLYPVARGAGSLTQRRRKISALRAAPPIARPPQTLLDTAAQPLLAEGALHRARPHIRAIQMTFDDLDKLGGIERLGDVFR